MARARHLPMAGLLAAASLLVTESGATIYQCVDAVTGVRTYTHHGCPAPTDGRSTYTPGNEPSFVMVPLSAAEQARLAALDATPGGQTRRPAANHRDAARKHCEEARATLRALRETRRQGYPLTAAGTLDARERAAKGARRRYC